MDYVLYTSFASYWDSNVGAYKTPNVEMIFFLDADRCSVIDDVFGVNDSFTSLAFWFGADAEDM